MKVNRYDLALNEMKKCTPIGTRVQYVGKRETMQNRTGTVKSHYPGFDENLERNKELDSIAVIDDSPEDCPYSNGTWCANLCNLEIHEL